MIPLSLESLWSLQKFQLPPTKMMSIMEVIEHYYQGFSDAGYLEDLNCRFLILMDSFDYYLDTLDWKVYFPKQKVSLCLMHTRSWEDHI